VAAPDTAVLAQDAVELAGRLRLVMTRLGRRAARGRPDGGVTPSRLVALDVLEAAGPVRVGALAEHLGTSAPTTSRLVECLHELGLVERTPDPDDHRATRVGLTARGLARLRAQRARATDDLARRIDGLGAHRRAVLAAALPVLDAIAQRDCPPTRPPAPRESARSSG